MLLTLDVGNTLIKYAVFKEKTLLELRFSEQNFLQKEIEKIVLDYPEISDCIVSSVGKWSENDFFAILKNIKIHVVSHRSKFPFINTYKTPQTLGIDRMILTSGAVLRFPNKNRLVIDVGTAITYDFVDKNNSYFGGAISPGIELRYHVLHTKTVQLPLLEKQKTNFFIGQNTSESIHSGVINGVAFEIEGFIDELNRKYDNFITILTGGNADFLAKKLKNTTFVRSNFLIESLNDLHQYQKKYV